MSAPSPALAALLSFFFPGLGQIYARDVRRGLIWAIPMALLVVALAWVLLGGQAAIMGLVFNDQNRLAILVLVVAFFFYQVATMLDAYAVARQERLVMGAITPRAAPVVMIGLLALAVVLNGSVFAVGLWGNEAIGGLFPGDRGEVIPPRSPRLPTPTPDTTPTATPTPSPTPTTGGVTSPMPSISPDGSPTTPTPRPRACPQVDPNWQMAQDGRVNLLLVGSDSRSEDGVSGTSLRTDTMILLSVDVATCKAAMFGFPRNMTNIPVGAVLRAGAESSYPGGVFASPNLLNSLWRRAAERPDHFPGSEGVSGADCARSFDCARAWRALTGVIQELADVDIDGVIAVNLQGFIALVNAVGGVWLDIPARLQDPSYRLSDGRVINLDIPRGCNFFEGEMALAYARSRRQDSDYQRMRRQQYVIAQVRRQLDPIALLPRAPDLVNAARANMFTTLDDSDLPHLAELASGVDADRMYQVRLVRQRFLTAADQRSIRERVAGIFDEPEPRPTPAPTGRPASCPAPGQTPRPFRP